MSKSLSRKELRELKRLAGFSCEYCRSQARFAMQSFSVEHITPKSRGGATTLKNAAYACQGCNNHKYNKTEGIDPATDKLALLFHPRRDKWSDHFTWSDDFSLIIGLTPTGRATVDTLQLNRERLVNLRRVLYPAGEHPPAAPGDESMLDEE